MFNLDVLNELFHHFFGGISLGQYLAGFLWCGIGAVLSYWITYKNRNKESETTPTKFNLKFFILDNMTRIVTGFITAFLFIRFASDIFGIDFTSFYAMLIGYGIDRGFLSLKTFEDKARGMSEKLSKSDEETNRRNNRKHNNDKEEEFDFNEHHNRGSFDGGK